MSFKGVSPTRGVPANNDDSTARFKAELTVVRHIARANRNVTERPPATSPKSS